MASSKSSAIIFHGYLWCSLNITTAPALATHAASSIWSCGALHAARVLLPAPDRVRCRGSPSSSSDAAPDAAARSSSDDVSSESTMSDSSLASRERDARGRFRIGRDGVPSSLPTDSSMASVPGIEEKRTYGHRDPDSTRHWCVSVTSSQTCTFRREWSPKTPLLRAASR